MNIYRGHLAELTQNGRRKTFDYRGKVADELHTEAYRMTLSSRC